MKDEKLYIVRMLECAERITSYTDEGRELFLRDSRTQDAVIRNFEILGEAAKHVSQATQQRAPDIPWRSIAGFRDVLIHTKSSNSPHSPWAQQRLNLQTKQRRCSVSRCPTQLLSI